MLLVSAPDFLNGTGDRNDNIRGPFRHFGKFLACNSFDKLIFILLYEIFFALYAHALATNHFISCDNFPTLRA
jgi:hypothetical protein